MTKLWQLESVWKFEREPSPANSDNVCFEVGYHSVGLCVRETGCTCVFNFALHKY